MEANRDENTETRASGSRKTRVTAYFTINIGHLV
jgi:hypothetical protein